MSAAVASATGAGVGWYLFVDGSSYAGGYGLDNNSGGSMGAACSASLVVLGLSIGTSHTFEMKFQTSAGAIACVYSLPTIVAEPI